MKIALTGSSGLIGTALRNFFHHLGNEVIPLKRDFTSADFEGVNMVINLAGEPVATRWTESMRRKIWDSRIETTKKLTRALNEMKKPPHLVINASGIAYYGDGHDKVLDETSPPGHGFLAETVLDWEKALNLPNVRIVYVRFGMVLSSKGGALKKMLLPFKLGLGGPIGSGKQFMSWIDLDDVVGAIYHIVNDESITGPVNIVAPFPVRNEKFVKTLGRVLNRPSILPIPAFMVRIIFGEMGESLLLSSSRVEPKVLLDTGYPFLYPNLEESLQKTIES